ncbi:hypothetical protein D0Y65_031805 [Glycine soja]|uniref:Uncharacterized protein n=1 Tax=Glycine soja TaxID=3848 RepID=A0A445IAI8_GLYSO|nr:hypothetical protein D0Y65_031805 [Glycine soja]
MQYSQHLMPFKTDTCMKHRSLASRKLLAPTLPDLGNSLPRLIFPPFPPVTDWPEYRLPPPLIRTLPPFSPPSATTTNP